MTATTLPAPEAWTDNKRYLWPLGALVLTLPLIGTFAYQLTGWTVMLWFGFFRTVAIRARDARPR